MDALEALRSRRSMRAYTTKPIPRELLEDFLDCARLAPSAMNRQRWHFVAITGRETLVKLAGASDNGSWLRDAAAAIAIVLEPAGPYLEDAACAAMAVMIAARAAEIGSCWFHCHGQPFETAVAEILGVPDDLRLILVLGLGYGVFPPPPPKKALADVCSWETFRD